MKKTKITISTVLGLVFLYITYIYATHNALALPAFFPGYTAGLVTVHIKHSIASFVLAAVFFAYAWFQGGPKKDSL